MRNNILVLFCLLWFTSCQKDDIRGGYDYQEVGTSANDFLSASVYTSLAVQIDYMPGYEPTQASVDALHQFLLLYLNKPGRITINKKAIAGTGHSTLLLDEIKIIERRNRTVFSGGNILTTHILITDGDYYIDDLLATSYGNTSAVIFGKNVARKLGSSGQNSSSILMSALLCHEMGHLMGLVNQGTPMLTDHEDKLNAAHCNNVNCLMNFGITTASSGVASPGPVPLLDANCHNDIIANGGK